MTAAPVLHLPRSSSHNAPDLKARVLAAAIAKLTEAVETLLKDSNGDLDLEALSETLLEKGRSVTSSIMTTMLSDKAGQGPATAPCPRCGKSSQRRTHASRTISTRHGDVAYARAYFYCTPCSHGFAPFDAKMGIAPQKNQYDLQKAAAKLLTEVPLEVAARLFKDLTGQNISDHTMHALGSRLGESARSEDILPSRKNVEAIISKHAQGRGWRPVLVVSADGAHMPTRPETGKRAGKRGAGSWQEAKGFRIYMVGRDRIEQIMSWHQIANEEEFGKALSFAATLIPQTSVRIALIADGAKWIWPHMREAFPDGREILDYYHCSEHVHELARLQFEGDEERQALWVESTMAHLYFGEVERVICDLQQLPASTEAQGKAIDDLIGYLRNNAHRIDYARDKRGQYPIGSGAIESANKFICHVRIKRSGAWWYKINGNRMLRLRCSMYNGTFDEVFARYKSLQESGAVKPRRTS